MVAAGVHRPTESGMAISAIAYALHETDTLAFVKYVSKDDGAPKIGLLFPCFDENITLLQYVEVRSPAFLFFFDKHNSFLCRFHLLVM